MKHKTQKNERPSGLKRWVVRSRAQVNKSILWMSLATIFWCMFSWGLGSFVDSVVLSQRTTAPLMVAALAIVLRSVFVRLGEQAAIDAGIRLVAAARCDVLGAILARGSQFLRGATSGARTSHIMDRTSALSGYAQNWLPGMRMALIGPVIILVAAALQSWVAAVLLLISVITLPLFIWLTASGVASAARAQQASLDFLSGAFQERTAKTGLIRAFRAISRETKFLENASEELRLRTMSILRVAFLSTAVIEFFASISIALVAVYVGFKLLGVFPFETGEVITLGEGLTVLILAPEFFAPIRRLSSLHHDRGNGVAADEVLSEWLSSGAEGSVKRLPVLSEAPVLSFKDVVLSYGVNSPATPLINLQIKPGQKTIIWGSSGCGKTTLLLSLIGQVKTMTGQICVDGNDLNPGNSLADSVVWFRQMPWLIEGTIAENIALATSNPNAAQIHDAALKAGIFEFATVQTGGLDKKLGRNGAGLSGGQRQRIALARAILRDSPIWLMDEPTAHLDPDIEADFLMRLEKVTRDRTVLIASHSLRVLEFGDQVIDLSDQKENKL